MAPRKKRAAEPEASTAFKRQLITPDWDKLGDGLSRRQLNELAISLAEHADVKDVLGWLKDAGVQAPVSTKNVVPNMLVLSFRPSR